MFAAAEAINHFSVTSYPVSLYECKMLNAATAAVTLSNLARALRPHIGKHAPAFIMTAVLTALVALSNSIHVNSVQLTFFSCIGRLHFSRLCPFSFFVL